MREKLGFLVGVWLLLCGFCLGRFVVEKNSLKLTSPDSLKGVYECAIGNFGVPQYGGTLVGTVVYPKANQKACKGFDEVDISFKSRPGGLPTFVLADRGANTYRYNADCYFTLKAWNAQNGGAAAILVADDKDEPLITMDTPEEENADADYLQNITIPSALISKSLGDSIKKAISNGEMVNMNLDWTEALPHPDERVEYEFWTSSNDECGPKCDSQIEFVKNFKGAARILEQKGYTQFTPHYITWYCPEAFVLSKQCKSQCINHGRYCAPDPEQDFSKGYDGKDVVVQNLRQACFYKVANESKKPWLWWDYVTDFSIRCPMKEKKYTKECADQVIQSIGVDLKKIDICIGDPEADVENEVLKAEQEVQVNWTKEQFSRRFVQDTFRGRVCECPMVQGVKFAGDGYSHCNASGSLRCEINNRGCWKKTQDGTMFSACVEDPSQGCKCPPGFKGDGVNSCEDVDECKDKVACQCSECKCKNTWGSYECSCSGGLLYMREHDTCIIYVLLAIIEAQILLESALKTGRYSPVFGNAARAENSWSFVWMIILGLATAGVAGYAIYKYRIRRYMDSEIRAIMAQYMPLDSQADIPVHHAPRGDI
ncbi:hypothetical protein POTOM_025306 [Populus tomentosa]|uniref:EGF-like calcium-binding domain-containing protein n=1 Tax=Populus tomentosa TaxID=118781 RepID=A0A8X7ZIX8_POPTO|nr:hypothetical protein POTOM_025306 [Populus tomentosa]